MRKIKFRIWHKETKKMYNVVKLTYDFLYNDRPYLYAKSYCKDGAIATFESKTLMQYTGLLDIQGKEIYEGDIVSYDHEYNGREGAIDEVVWDEHGILLDDLLYLNGAKNIKVIGNIYENPDLIEDEN